MVAVSVESCDNFGGIAEDFNDDDISDIDVVIGMVWGPFLGDWQPVNIVVKECGPRSSVAVPSRNVTHDAGGVGSRCGTKKVSVV